MTGDDLVQKYCFQHYQMQLKTYRKFAIKNNLRRPWDGEDGADFEAVKNTLSALLFSAGEDVNLDKVVNNHVIFL